MIGVGTEDGIGFLSGKHQGRGVFAWEPTCGIRVLGTISSTKLCVHRVLCVPQNSPDHIEKAHHSAPSFNLHGSCLLHFAGRFPPHLPPPLTPNLYVPHTPRAPARPRLWSPSRGRLTPSWSGAPRATAPRAAGAQPMSVFRSIKQPFLLWLLLVLMPSFRGCSFLCNVVQCMASMKLFVELSIFPCRAFPRVTPPNVPFAPRPPPLPGPLPGTCTPPCRGPGCWTSCWPRA